MTNPHPAPRSAVLVRGVGGPTAMRMPALREALEAAGLGAVTTLQVAGNVVVDRGGLSQAELARRVRETIHAAFGHELPVLVRDHEELRGLVAANPYLGSHPGKWVLTMVLDREPEPAAVEAVLEAVARIAPRDRLTIGSRALFLRYADGVAGSRLQTAWLERQLGVVGTARNANTIERLIDLTAPVA